jgi:hypothetical protein
MWVRPDWRGQNVSGLTVRLARCVALGQWNFDHSFGMMQPAIVQSGVWRRTGLQHFDDGIRLTMSFGTYEFALLWVDRDEFITDMIEIGNRPELLAA